MGLENGMIAEHKIKMLQGFLGKLPGPIAGRLAKAIEVDRLGGGSVLPHDAILDSLRPILRNAQTSDRTLTPLRLLCRPFEDLLFSTPRQNKLKGKIARDSVMLLWNWVSTELLPDAAAAFERDATAAIMTGKIEAAETLVTAFSGQVSLAILSVLQSKSGVKAAEAALGDSSIVDDAREMAQLLGVAQDIRGLQEKLPKPFPTLTDDEIWVLREFYDRILAALPDAAPYVAVITMNRLERPWEALRLPLQISRQTQDTLISKTDMGLVGEILFAEMEENAAAIRKAKPRHFDVDRLTAHIARFAELSTGLVKSVDIRRDGEWGQRLLKDRAAIAEIMDGFMERAPKDVLAAIPMQKTGRFSGGPSAPDLRHAPDPEKTVIALANAKLIIGCKPFAAASSFGTSLKDARDQLIQALRAYSEELVRELRGEECERRYHAEAYLEIAVELTSLLAGTQDGELLRRRGRAALAPREAA